MSKKTQSRTSFCRYAFDPCWFCYVSFSHKWREKMVRPWMEASLNVSLACVTQQEERPLERILFQSDLTFVWFSWYCPDLFFIMDDHCITFH